MQASDGNPEYIFHKVARTFQEISLGAWLLAHLLYHSLINTVLHAFRHQIFPVFHVVFSLADVIVRPAADLQLAKELYLLRGRPDIVMLQLILFLICVLAIIHALCQRFGISLLNALQLHPHINNILIIFIRAGNPLGTFLVHVIIKIAIRKKLYIAFILFFLFPAGISTANRICTASAADCRLCPAAQQQHQCHNQGNYLFHIHAVPPCRLNPKASDRKLPKNHIPTTKFYIKTQNPAIRN